ncbi:MAG: 23S rRNA (guanosine(2251)-2'-O)-methyltransferase RlmB [Ignavibacteria bacterium]
MLVIGRNPIIEILLTEPKSLTRVIIMKTNHPHKRAAEISKLCKEAGIPVMYLARKGFSKYFSSKTKEEGIAQGVIAFMKDFQYKPLTELVQDISPVQNPLLIILDEITDPHNLGAIIRSAAALGADGVIIPKHNSAEVNHTVIKASAGAVKHIPIVKVTNLANTIRYLKDHNFLIVGTDLKTEKIIFETDFKQPIALVIGSEGKGMRKTIRELCNFTVRIPMAGHVESLNASVSAAIFLYEIFRQKNS